MLICFEIGGREQLQFKKNQMKNLKVTHAMNSMMAEYFRPEISRPSPICPATSPEKNPWSRAAWVNNRLYWKRSICPINPLAPEAAAEAPAVAMVVKNVETRIATTNRNTAKETSTIIT